MSYELPVSALCNARTQSSMHSVECLGLQVAFIVLSFMIVHACHEYTDVPSGHMPSNCLRNHTNCLCNHAAHPGYNVSYKAIIHSCLYIVSCVVSIWDGIAVKFVILLVNINNSCVVAHQFAIGISSEQLQARQHYVYHYDITLSLPSL